MNDWALVIVDCLRYDHADAFDFQGLRRLDRVASVGNWTLPAVTTMVTGLHPLEHRAGCEPISGNVVNSMQSWPSTLRGYDGPTIVDDDTTVLYEIPVLSIALRPPRPGSWRRCNKARKAHEQAWDHLDAERLVIHLKGGHSPWRYVGIPNSENEYGLEVLHVPVWYKSGGGWSDVVLPDELYDLRVVHDLLSGRQPTSRQVAFSTSPGHGAYDRVAATYLVGGELRCDVFQTSRPFDLEA